MPSAAQIDAAKFLAFVFQRSKRQQTPCPYILLDEQLTKLYEKHCTSWLESREHVAVLRLTSQLRHLKQAETVSFFVGTAESCRWSVPQFQHHVLADRSLPFSPLFRLCTAARLGLHDCRDFYLGPAAWQYFREPWIYDRVWGSLMPTDFRKQARQVYLTIRERMIEDAAA